MSSVGFRYDGSCGGSWLADWANSARATVASAIRFSDTSTWDTRNSLTVDAHRLVAKSNGVHRDAAVLTPASMGGNSQSDDCARAVSLKLKQLSMATQTMSPILRFVRVPAKSAGERLASVGVSSSESEMHIELLFPTDWSSRVLIYGAVALVMTLIRRTISLNSGNSEQQHQLL